MSDAQRDRLLAVLALIFAAACVAAARAIEDSSLADAVGAGGVPQGVGVGMGLAAVALFAKSFFAAAAPAGDTQSKPWRKALLRTSALVLALLGYAALLPLLGYPLTVSLLVLATGWLAGAALMAPLWLCAAFSGPLLWALFDLLLKVRMSVGSWWT